ncbi:MAG: acetyl-CoA carboxylase carboxyltransferase subunit alpha [Nitrospinota bacterium]|nr:acetyl-CoA carboxylase carboxyltransferase subunit alpha [Nitrospinota bacterium]
MSTYFLDFEAKIAELEKKLEELRSLGKEKKADFSDEIKKMHKKINQMREETFTNLTRWQRTLLARHPDRPYAYDYIREMTTGFVELHGDRYFGDGPSIVGGFATMDDKPVMIIGQQKGRDTKEKMYRNFGMAHPEGYRKSLRLMKLAEKFKTPIITLIDTAGAYPGIGAEERGQAEAIARNLLEMASLKVPVICVVTGEGGSGGALAIGVGNRVLMMEYSVYSVISPEGCAAILWKDQAKIAEAAEALALTANDLLQQGIIDEVVQEPIGGAHRDPAVAAHTLRRVLRRHLAELSELPVRKLVDQRREKFRRIGTFTE